MKCKECGQSIKKTTKKQGDLLENLVADILKRRGCKDIQIRKRHKGKFSNPEIDIMAITKNGTKIAVECKNHKHNIATKEIAYFRQKLVDLGIKRGLFVTSSDFVRNGEKYATSNKIPIETWNNESLCLHWDYSADRLAIELGGTGGRSKRVPKCRCIICNETKKVTKRKTRKTTKNKKNIKKTDGWTDDWNF